jgi:NTP pyrophosphatase (non-canonical NTP hydrolase)
VDLPATQRAVMELKRRQGFNTTDIPLELCFLQGEIAELFEAWHHSPDNLGEELADVAIYLLSLASMLDVDLETEISAKMAKNATRRYVRRGDALERIDP